MLWLFGRSITYFYAILIFYHSFNCVFSFTYWAIIQSFCFVTFYTYSYMPTITNKIVGGLFKHITHSSDRKVCSLLITRVSSSLSSSSSTSYSSSYSSSFSSSSFSSAFSSSSFFLHCLLSVHTF